MLSDTLPVLTFPGDVCNWGRDRPLVGIPSVHSYGDLFRNHLLKYLPTLIFLIILENSLNDVTYFSVQIQCKLADIISTILQKSKDFMEFD